MGMYNMLFGMNQDTREILAMLGYEPADIPRLRDTYLTSENGETLIAVYTRMGGGNRGHWPLFSWDGDEEEPDDVPCWNGVDTPPSEMCPGCEVQKLSQHELYVRDFDSDYDSTYATYLFRVPEKYNRRVLQMQMATHYPDERWEKMQEALEADDTSNPPYARFKAWGEQLAEAIVEKATGGHQAGGSIKEK